MIEIVILAGTCGAGSGTYELGLFHLPDGSARGVEDLTDLIVPPDPVVSMATCRVGIARGLREALAATGPLPRPLGLAASVLGAGLDVLGGDGRSGLSVELRFADGATATIRTDAEGVARIGRDRDVVRRAALRFAARSAEDTPAESLAEPPGGEPATLGPDARALASIFAYEKRGGRLRRLSAKTSMMRATSDDT
ncbi:hypothetical protein [Methylobacterium flocculans]|uniref:hypothetical protein n=1 Tax=Methylobacterium flocculans TaxID=2984843 RepID=UPI0021F288E3|nr:hypothetical protein [Methylobacterium sp. FF17]